MSRVLKFRVYSNYYKKYLDTSGKGIFCEVHHLALKPDGKLYYADIGIDYPGTLSECPTLEWEEDYDDCVVEQYTGLTDKNGKEIYEGDIVKTNSPDQPNFKVGVIEFAQQAFWISNVPSDRPDHTHSELLLQYWETEIEVIGNIHENKELWDDSEK